MMGPPCDMYPGNMGAVIRTPVAASKLQAERNPVSWATLPPSANDAGTMPPAAGGRGAQSGRGSCGPRPAN